VHFVIFDAAGERAARPKITSVGLQRNQVSNFPFQMSNKNALKAGISIACLVLLFFQIGPESLQIMFWQADPFVIATLLILLCTMLLLQAVRWWLIGKKLGLKWSFLMAIELAFVGVFFSQILPSSSGGDAVRVWQLTRAGIPVRHAFSSVVLDRVSALIAIGLIFCFGLPVLYRILGNYVITVDAKLLYAALLLALGFTGCAAWLYARFLSIRQIRVVRAIGKLGSDAKLVLLSPTLLLSTTALSLVTQITVGWIVWRLASDFGAKLDFIEFSLLWPVVLIMSFLPISIAGWGVREGAMVLAFNVLGNPSSIALATSVAFGILMLLAGIPGGVVLFVSSFRKSSMLIEHKEH
jgi:uncharacterized protein (TIRG00374 family)